MQIEFIRPHSNKPSAYSHAMTGGPVLHHYGIMVDDLAEATEALRNPEKLASARTAEGTPLCYLDGREKYGMVLELVESGEDVLAVYKHLRDEAENWDGSNPLRPFPGAEAY